MNDPKQDTNTEDNQEDEGYVEELWTADLGMDYDSKEEGSSMEPLVHDEEHDEDGPFAQEVVFSEVFDDKDLESMHTFVFRKIDLCDFMRINKGK